MQVTRIRLHNFRSYEKLTLQPAPGLCVLVGENAAGKTNVLESMFLCAVGRSHRTRHDAELIRMGQPGALVGLDIEKRSGSHTIECRLRQDERRQLTIDGAALTRSGELLGCLNVVMFSPEDLKLVKQGPAERRRFMDMELSQLQPAYYYKLQRYNGALRQRNALLKDWAHCEKPVLEVFTQQLAQLGAAVIVERAAFLARIGVLAASAQHTLSDGREVLTLRYQPALPADTADLVTALYDQMMATAERDALRYGGNTATGPHRDDFSLAIGGKDARIYASQGQQRTAALSLKLAQLKLMREERGDAPVLLLDDVLSELDEGRQRMLSDAMRGCQTFLTCTHLSGLAGCGLGGPGEQTVYRVKDGTVLAEG